MLAKIRIIQASEIPRAVHMMRVSQRLRRSLGLSLLPEQQEAHDQHIQQARTALGEDAFTTAWEESLLPWEQAVEELLTNAPIKAP